MKFIHLSDLHLGKRLNEFSLIEDQMYILTKIINIIDDEKPDGVIIAGDVYDKSVPSEEAVRLFDDFLTRLAKRDLSVFVISGNHDSPERLAFASRLIEKSGVYISPAYSGETEKIRMEDEYGAVNIYLLPFIKPAHVRRFFPDENTESYTDAVRVAINHMCVNTDERNIIVTHQFVTGAERSDSEEISVGGSDNVDASVFEAFDYTALGHIHGSQNIGKTVRYCGTPLKYSFSEAAHEKSVTVIEIGKKGCVEIRTVPISAKRDMRILRGSYDELTLKENYKDTNTDDYIQITLTDEEDIPDAIGKLRVIYPNIMKLDYDNKRTRENKIIDEAEDAENKSPLELFSELFEKQNNRPMSDEQKSFCEEIIEEIWRDEICDR